MAIHRDRRSDDGSRQKRPAAEGGRSQSRAGGVANFAQATSLRFSPLLPSAALKAIMSLQYPSDRL